MDVVRRRREQEDKKTRMFEKTFFMVLNNVAMIEWDGLKRLRQLHDG
jgi:hypothetical protein